jgi:hypothetical protein
MVLVPKALYDKLLLHIDKNDAVIIRQLNNLDVHDGGKVNVRNDDHYPKPHPRPAQTYPAPANNDSTTGNGPALNATTSSQNGSIISGLLNTSLPPDFNSTRQNQHDTSMRSQQHDTSMQVDNNMHDVSVQNQVDTREHFAQTDPNTGRSTVGMQTENIPARYAGTQTEGGRNQASQANLHGPVSSQSTQANFQRPVSSSDRSMQTVTPPEGSSRSVQTEVNYPPRSSTPDPSVQPNIRPPPPPPTSPIGEMSYEVDDDDDVLFTSATEEPSTSRPVWLQTGETWKKGSRYGITYRGKNKNKPRSKPYSKPRKLAFRKDDGKRAKNPAFRRSKLSLLKDKPVVPKLKKIDKNRQNMVVRQVKKKYILQDKRRKLAAVVAAGKIKEARKKTSAATAATAAANAATEAARVAAAATTSNASTSVKSHPVKKVTISKKIKKPLVAFFDDSAVEEIQDANIPRREFIQKDTQRMVRKKYPGKKPSAKKPATRTRERPLKPPKPRARSLSKRRHPPDDELVQLSKNKSPQEKKRRSRSTDRDRS